MRPLKLLSTIAVFLVSLTVSAQQVRLTDKELYNAIWAMGQMYPEGFTIDLNTLRQPDKGIMVSYKATQNSFDKKSITASWVAGTIPRTGSTISTRPGCSPRTVWPLPWLLPARTANTLSMTPARE